MKNKRCPFCAEEILADAIKCKHCGEFLGAPGKQKPAPTLTIQATGKKWKLLRLLGGLIVVAASFGFGYGYKIEATALTAAGVAIILFSLVGAWWHHG